MVTQATKQQAHGVDWHSFFSLPNPVNEVSARLVAGGVVVMSASAIVFHQPWITVVIAYGFLARMLTGPKASPLGQLVTRLVTPRLPVKARLVAGPPKRFAQSMGFVVSTAAAVLALGLRQWGAAEILLGLLIVAATLESVFGFCLGCKIFAFGMRAGLIPERVCEACNNLALRRPA
jgi:type IV secretory pathway TrbD component